MKMRKCSILSEKQFLHMWDRFFFCVVAATAFVMALCHWILDINYKYTVDIKANHLDVQAVFIIAAIASLFFLIKKGKIVWDIRLIMLIQVMVLIGVQDYHKEDYIAINYAWIIPIAYIIGKLVVGTDKAEINKKILVLYTALAVGAYIIAFLDFLMNWKIEWGYGTERWPEFWTGVVEPRTTFEMGLILVTVAFPFAFLIFKRHKIIATGIIMINILSQYILYHVQGRQNPLMLVISVMIVICLYLYDNWQGIDVKVKRNIYRVVLVMVGLLIIGIILFSANAFGIKDFYKQSYWADGGLLHNERLDIDWKAFKCILKYPMEDYQERYGWARGHSMALEYGRVYDMTSYIGIAIVRILLLIDGFRLIGKKGRNSWIKYLIFPAFVCVNIYYSLEPNAFAHRYLWMMGLFLSGMIRGWLELDNKQEILLCEKSGVLAKRAALNVE